MHVLPSNAARSSASGALVDQVDGLRFLEAGGRTRQRVDLRLLLVRQLRLEAAHVFLSCWIRLYGLLCMEVLHQLDFAYSDLEPVSEECLRDLSAMIGLDEG